MKKRTLRISAGWIWTALLVITLVANILVALIPDFNLPKAIFGTVWLFILPGWLITRIIRLRTTSPWERLAFGVGFGILSVMLTALVMNTVLPLFGNNHPLSAGSLIIGLDVVWLGLTGLAWRRNQGAPIVIHVPKFSLRETLYATAGLPIVALSVMGALSLNNGGTNRFTYVMLIAAAVYLVALLRHREDLKETTVLAGVYCIGLALLLMTSLRGWFTTGHDIQREYQVFILTLSQLHWSVASLKDAYNACLSITILPTAVQQITGINSVYIYKTVFQLIFALVPVLVYLIARRHTSKFIALLASVYFMAFPTYFTDMPMLNRQEIAFLFLSLMFIVIFNNAWSLNRRRWLVGVLGLGVVLSHYSTTYTMIALFALVIGLRYGMKLVAVTIKQPSHRRLPSLARWRRTGSSSVNLAIMCILLGASYIWSVQLTNTGGNISKVVTETIKSIGGGISGDTKSSDTSYSFFGGSKLTDQQRLDAYVAQATSRARASSSPDSLYPEATYSSYKPTVATEANLPLTGIGKFLNDHGVPVATLNNDMRQGSALLLQLMLGIGIVIIFVARPFSTRLGNDYRLFQLASIIMIAAILLLPVLSAEYGILRAFQQILIIGGVAIALATVSIIPAKFKRLREAFGILCAVGFLVSSTGVITTTLGGYPAQLHLANSGKYYDLYYAHSAEQDGVNWLVITTTKNDDPKEIASSTSTDRYTVGKILQFSGNDDLNDDIYPAVLHRGSYVFLGYTTVNTGDATVFYNNDPITYQYPTGFLDNNKNLLYANNGARVYQ